MELPFPSSHTKPKRQIHFRNVKNINMDALALDLQHLSSGSTDSLSVADSVKLYNQSLSSLLDLHAPLTSSLEELKIFTASCYAVHYLHLVATWRRWFLSFHTCVRSAHHQFLLESEISCQPAPVRRYVYTYFPCHRTPACLTTRLPSPCLPVIEPLPVGLSFWFLTPRLF
ncbi:unnamed protein product [Boreogadus saida]